MENILYLSLNTLGNHFPNNGKAIEIKLPNHCAIWCCKAQSSRSGMYICSIAQSENIIMQYSYNWHKSFPLCVEWGENWCLSKSLLLVSFSDACMRQRRPSKLSCRPITNKSDFVSFVSRDIIYILGHELPSTNKKTAPFLKVKLV